VICQKCSTANFISARTCSRCSAPLHAGRRHRGGSRSRLIELKQHFSMVFPLQEWVADAPWHRPWVRWFTFCAFPLLCVELDFRNGRPRARRVAVCRLRRNSLGDAAVSEFTPRPVMPWSPCRRGACHAWARRIARSAAEQRASAFGCSRGADHRAACSRVPSANSPRSSSLRKS